MTWLCGQSTCHSIHRIHMVIRENWLPQVVFWPPHMCGGKWVCMGKHVGVSAQAHPHTPYKLNFNRPLSMYLLEWKPLSKYPIVPAAVHVISGKGPPSRRNACFLTLQLFPPQRLCSTRVYSFWEGSLKPTHWLRSLLCCGGPYVLS